MQRALYRLVRRFLHIWVSGVYGVRWRLRYHVRKELFRRLFYVLRWLFGRLLFWMHTYVWIGMHHGCNDDIRR